MKKLLLSFIFILVPYSINAMDAHKVALIVASGGIAFGGFKIGNTVIRSGKQNYLAVAKVPQLPITAQDRNSYLRRAFSGGAIRAATSLASVVLLATGSEKPISYNVNDALYSAGFIIGWGLVERAAAQKNISKYEEINSSTPLSNYIYGAWLSLWALRGFYNNK